jgi:hypothetical protein
MHDYPPLVSGALKLLFRHFAQRQEVLQAFKQVTKNTKEQGAQKLTGENLKIVWAKFSSLS